MNQSKLLSSLIQLIASLVEIIIGFRILLKLFGASTQAPFVRWIYQTSSPLLTPFSGMFPSPQLDGLFQIEFSAIFALIVYTFVFFLINEAVYIINFESTKRSNKHP